MCEQEKCHWKKLYVNSFEIFYFYLNHKENKLQFFTEHLQTKHNLLYKNGGYRVAIQMVSLLGAGRFKLHGICILFEQIFVCHMSSKESIVFISFHNKTWRYDGVTTALWQNQIIVIFFDPQLYFDPHIWVIFWSAFPIPLKVGILGNWNCY